ncbi:GTPase HflX [Vagococcus coleopterorum]|uniref:GTPase HflX n=1 Tax=Vagococcus coleopterorum TaxID=2714946 RepID=A0A6G8APP4_9ENTE|nr:GTPase HflX [Vagococcus coleopterorum]QIL46905.1 GTPase HflX [Vagococcus coleopterorum]
MFKEKERVVVVGVETADNYRYFEESLREAANLIETAQGVVVHEVIQKRPAVDRKTIVGKGKLEELVQLIDAYEADLVVFNQELTPRQSQLLSEACQVKVIDRVQLILDIFAMRAQSKAGKLQVELAQLNYLLPRLTGQGAALSRLGGGIGTRGPGETKLETDRRHIRNKITNIKTELKEVAASRERNRQKRQSTGIFQIGLIGYTNAGKSTLLNRLTNAEAYSQDQLFATLDPLTKQWQLAEGFEVTLTDTVGFIQDLPTQLIEAFQSTLEESRNMDLLLHVVDASSADRDLQEQTVLKLMDELEMDDVPVLTVYNKMDQVEQADFTPTLFPHIQVSAKRPEDRQVIEAGIRQRLMELFIPYEFELAVDQGYKLTKLTTDTLVINQEFDEEQEVYRVAGFAPENSRWLPKEESEW